MPLVLTVKLTLSSGFSPTQTIGTVEQDADGNDMVRLTFAGLSFTKAGQPFTITIKKVRARDKGGAVEFTTRVSGSGEDLATITDGVSADDLAKSPKLYITDTQNDAVEFQVNGQTFETFTAGQELD